MSSGLPTTPISIAVSAAEKSSGRLTQRSLEVATRALVRDGLVVLEDVIDHTVLDRLNEKMVKDAYELQSRKDSPYDDLNIESICTLTWIKIQLQQRQHPARPTSNIRLLRGLDLHQYPLPPSRIHRSSNTIQTPS